MNKFFNNRAAKKAATGVGVAGVALTGIALALGTLEIVFTGKSTIFRGGTLDAIIKGSLVTTAAVAATSGIVVKYTHREYIADMLDKLAASGEELSEADAQLCRSIGYSCFVLEDNGLSPNCLVLENMGPIASLVYKQYSRTEFFLKEVDKSTHGTLEAVSDELEHFAKQILSGVDKPEAFVWEQSATTEG